MKRLFVIYFFLLIIHGTYCQTNLVVNPSFEDHYLAFWPGLCDTGAIGINWYNPSDGNPDYFHTITTCWASAIPSNCYGFQYPYDGNYYFGIGVYWGEDTSMTYLFREYVTLGLSEPLIENQCYFVSYYVSLADTFACAIDEMSALFTNTLINYDTNGVIPGVPQINNPHGRFLDDNKGWMQVSGYYTAHGGENFITIGNFKDDLHTDSIMVYGPSHYPGGIIGNHQASCYYIDMVSVTECPDTVLPETPKVVFIPNIFSPNSDGNNDFLFVRGSNIKELTFSIYNRWGELVFETHDISTGWDGTYKSKPCDQAVYLYHARVVFDDGTEQDRSGNITLVR